METRGRNRTPTGLLLEPSPACVEHLRLDHPVEQWDLHANQPPYRRTGFVSADEPGPRTSAKQKAQRPTRCKKARKWNPPPEPAEVAVLAQPLLVESAVEVKRIDAPRHRIRHTPPSVGSTSV